MLSSGTFPSRTRAQIEDRAINQLITGTSFSAPRRRVNPRLPALLSRRLRGRSGEQGCRAPPHPLLLGLFPPCLSCSSVSSSLFASVLLQAGGKRGGVCNWGLWGAPGWREKAFVRTWTCCMSSGVSSPSRATGLTAVQGDLSTRTGPRRTAALESLPGPAQGTRLGRRTRRHGSWILLCTQSACVLPAWACTCVCLMCSCVWASRARKHQCRPPRVTPDPLWDVRKGPRCTAVSESTGRVRGSRLGALTLRLRCLGAHPASPLTAA